MLVKASIKRKRQINIKWHIRNINEEKMVKSREETFEGRCHWYSKTLKIAQKKTGVANPSDFTKPFQVRRPARYLPFATALVCGIGNPIMYY